ncbi:MAG: hypothetical protein IKG84_06965 [Bacteroidales bacterium]|nr:hypothetical protein [Bacteroidales bacterium]
MIKQYIEMAGFTEEDVKVYSMLKDDASKFNWAKNNINRMTDNFMQATKNIMAIERGSYSSKRSKAYNMLSMLFTVSYMEL